MSVLHNYGYSDEGTRYYVSTGWYEGYMNTDFGSYDSVPVVRRARIKKLIQTESEE